MHAMNLLTRLNWEWRVAAAEGRARVTTTRSASRLDELADYLLFVGEATPVVEVHAAARIRRTPRAPPRQGIATGARWPNST